MAKARVIPKDADAFTCEIEELRPNSILLSGAKELPFRSHAEIEVSGAKLDGEVVFAADGKLALTFPTTPEIFEAIEAIESEASEDEEDAETPDTQAENDIPHDDILAAIDNSLASYVTAEVAIASPATLGRSPTVRKGALVAEEDIDRLAWCLALLSDHPIVARAEGIAPSSVKLVVGDHTLMMSAERVGGGWLGLVARDREAVKVAVRDLRETFDGLVEDPLPSLESDGVTVRFASKSQYKKQKKANLDNGALVVLSGPIPAGATRLLKLVVPGLDPMEATGTATYQADGTVGFSITDLTSVAPTTTGDIPQITADLQFKGPTDIAQLLKPGPGTYLDSISKLLANPGRSVVYVRGGDDVTLRLWLDSGRLVFTARQPIDESNLIGERLMAARVVQKSAIEEAIENHERGRSIGAFLLEKGHVTTTELHRTLRAQMIQRAAEPALFEFGHIEVKPWDEPPIRGNLLAVSGGSVLAHIVRQCVGTTPLEKTRDALDPLGDCRVDVHLDRVETSYRIRDNELKALTSAAREETVLKMFLRTRGVKPAEIVTLVLLGRALGFLELRGQETADIGQPTVSADLEEVATRLDTGNHFDVLEVHWAASHAEILEAFERAKQRTHPKRARNPEEGAVLAKIRDKVKIAFGVVGQRKSRMEYRKKIFDERERKRAAKHLIEQAELAVLRQDPSAAENMLDAADELATLTASKRLRVRCQQLRGLT